MPLQLFTTLAHRRLLPSSGSGESTPENIMKSYFCVLKILHFFAFFTLLGAPCGKKHKFAGK